jgi:hypothetical protein
MYRGFYISCISGQWVAATNEKEFVCGSKEQLFACVDQFYIVALA